MKAIYFSVYSPSSNGGFMKAFLTVFLFIGFFGHSAHSAKASDSVKLADLKSTDHLKKSVSELATEWLDNNISDGTTAIYTARSDMSDTGRTVAESLMRQTFKKHEEKNLPKDATLKVKTTTLESKISGKTVEKAPAIREVTKSLTKSNAFSNYSKEMEDQLVNVIKILESERSHGQEPSLVARPAALEYTSVKTKIHDESSDADKQVELYVFRNVETGKMIVVYTVEGFI
jgi:hypothetical protein